MHFAPFQVTLSCGNGRPSFYKMESILRYFIADDFAHVCLSGGVICLGLCYFGMCDLT